MKTEREIEIATHRMAELLRISDEPYLDQFQRLANVTAERS
jgi:hypothetical protein